MGRQLKDELALQNGEQGRNRPDPGTANLVLLFDRAPEAVAELLSEPVI